MPPFFKIMVMKTFLCFLILAVSARGATLKPSEEQTGIFSRTVAYVFSDSFVEAYALAGELEETIPGRPIYNLLYASVIFAEMSDAEDYSRKQSFTGRIDSSISMFNDWTKENPDDPWGYFFAGTAHAYKSVMHGQNRSWLKSLIDGLKAKGKFAKALQLDPDLYDSYTGMGNYHYWSSARLGKYIPFLPDNREKGIEEMGLAMDSSIFSFYPAAGGLAWALINESRLSDAAKIGKRLYEETAGGRVSIWILGGVYWRMGNLSLAGAYYDELINSLERAGNQNNYNLIFARYRKGVCLFSRHDDQAAKREFEMILKYEVSGEVKEKHEKTYKKTKEYLKEIKSRENPKPK